jgi:hypothetical protein
LQPGRLGHDQVGLLLPHRDVGDVVLQRLELADLAAERLALGHVPQGVFQHAVQDADAERRQHDALVVQRGDCSGVP